MNQECALRTVYGCLLRSPQPCAQSLLAAIRVDPNIIPLMLRCAALPMTSWYPESEVQPMMAESLVALFQYPVEIIPGVEIPLEGERKEAWDGEWETMLDSLELASQVEDFVEGINAVWDTVCKEDWKSVRK